MTFTARSPTLSAVLILQPLPGLRIVGRPLTRASVPPARASLSNLTDSGLDPRVVATLHEISRRLTLAGIRHAVVGALAVGVYGWARATKDVDLLLGDEAWARLPSGERRALVPLPESIDGVGVDYLPLDIAGDFLNSALDHPFTSEGVPIAPPEVVVCTKLLRMAMRDQADIVEMIKAGLIDVVEVRRYLVEHTPMLVSRWEALAAQAETEREAALR